MKNRNGMVVVIIIIFLGVVGYFSRKESNNNTPANEDRQEQVTPEKPTGKKENVRYPANTNTVEQNEGATPQEQTTAISIIPAPVFMRTTQQLSEQKQDIIELYHGLHIYLEPHDITEKGDSLLVNLEDDEFVHAVAMSSKD